MQHLVEGHLPLRHSNSRDDIALSELRSSGKIVADGYYSGSSEVQVQGLNLTRAHSERERLTPDASGIVLALVGLPARGKSFVSRKLERFLQWRGHPTRMFNVGKYRREAVAPEESGRSDFFDQENTSALAAREAAAVAALKDALDYLNRGGRVAILDATNSTKARRKLIVDQVQQYRGCGRFAVVFVEAICDDPEVLEANMLGKVRNSPDFERMSIPEAMADLKDRIEKYAAVYETVQDSEGPYIKVFDLSSKIMANHCYGRLAKSMLPLMMAMHIGARPVWLVRAGTGQGNPQSPDKSDRLSKLSDLGRTSALALSEFLRQRATKYWATVGKTPEPTQVLTSTMPRARASVYYVTRDHEQTSALNPIDKGTIGAGWWDVECHGDTPPWQEMQQRHPVFYAKWRQDPLRRRFPGGESYMDVIQRLEGVLVEVEMSTRPVLLVSHISVLQLFVAYFKGVPIEDAWQVSIPKNTVLEISPTSGGGFLYSEHPLSAVPLPETSDASTSSRCPSDASAPDDDADEDAAVPAAASRNAGAQEGAFGSGAGAHGAGPHCGADVRRPRGLKRSSDGPPAHEAEAIAPMPKKAGNRCGACLGRLD